ncbi:ATP-binding protein [Actinomadura rudentiformis]|uniref:ATP-binding protein n=1 Tax=Actinomadura rudentiformis TaxID=359158 RepID=UPI00178C33B5|nr:ATP-binding protein [Actinomadura rudentiformis]
MSDPRLVGVLLGHIRLPRVEASAKAARDLVAMSARAWDVGDDVAYRARLAASELATNAVRHGGGTEMLVFSTRVGTRLRVEVHDASPALPVRRDPAVTDVSGRGLLIVDDIVTACGCYPTATGKAAWFEIEAAWPREPGPVTGPRPCASLRGR